MSTQTVRAALSKEAERLRTEYPEDAAKRVRQCVAMHDALLEAQVVFAEIKTAAIRELYHDYGWTTVDLAQEFGITRQRALQLVKR